jgi:Tol biopolymer transport system component
MITPLKKFNVILGLILITLMSVSGHVWASDDEQQSPYADWAIPSRDGSKLAYVVSGPDKLSTIWISDRDGSNPRILIDWPDSMQTEPDWSTDGQNIVFASNRGSRRSNIWTIQVDGSLPTQLTTDAADDRQPRYSPDGSKILFTSNRTGKRELWYMASNGSGQKAIGLQSLLVGDPSWSADGKNIVYTGCTLPPGQAFSKGVCNLFTISLDASTARQVTSGIFEDWNPDWGASEIIFNSNRNHTSGLWLVNPNGSSLRQITSNSLDLHPKWDRSSNSAVFTRGNEIWSTDLLGNETQLTHIADANHHPVANAGADQTVECAGQGGTNVTLNGSASSDQDNDILTYTWTGQFGTVNGPTPTVALSMGLNTITLTVTDGKGGTSSDEVIVNVVDTTAPSIENVSANPSLLWPPNHKMTSVVVNVSASDSCSPTTVCKIVSVNSNESINGLGDGDTAPDWEINGNLGVTLRAERAGTGNGRIYTITVQCTDASGNSATKETVVTVPRNGSTK